MEEFALAKESDEASVERLARLRADLADHEEELRGLEARWEQEKATLEDEGELRRRLDAVRVHADKLMREGRLDEAARSSTARSPRWRSRWPSGAATAQRSADGSEGPQLEPLVGEEVGAEQIADVRGGLDRHPHRPHAQGETAKLLEMEAVIGERLIGQREAVGAVSDAVRRSRAGIADPHRPTGSFLFLGPHRHRQDRARQGAGRLPSTTSARSCAST